jgi:hypothetical protein
MAIGSGLGGQIGFAEETTYGTYVAPTRFLEFNDESLKADVVHVESRGIGSGRWLRTARHKEYVKGAAGSVEFDVKTKGFGLLFKHMLGDYTNANVVGNEQKATIVPDANGKAGLKLTTQVGRPDIGGTVRPFSYEGCKITGWEFSASLDDPLRLSIDIDAETEQTASALASPSYPTGDEIFVMSEGAVTLNGSTIHVKSFSLKGAEGLATDRRFIGNLKKEPLANAEAMVTGELEFELEGLTRHGQWLAGTEIPNLVVTFTTPTSTGGGGGPFKLVLTVPLLKFDDGGSNLDGPEIVGEEMSFKALKASGSPIAQIEYFSTDTAA